MCILRSSSVTYFHVLLGYYVAAAMATVLSASVDVTMMSYLLLFYYY